MTRGSQDGVLAALHVAGPETGGVVAAVVATAARVLGLDAGPAEDLAVASRAVTRAVERRGFDDPADAEVEVTVLRRAHRVVVHLDDLGLPFDFGAGDEDDGTVVSRAVQEGWIDAIGHQHRGREGNRTILVRHLDPGPDLRHTADPDEHEAAHRAPPAAGDVEHTTRLATPADVEGICRLTWRTYGPTYQHDEYYFPRRLTHLLESGEQISIVTVDAEGEVIGHSAMLLPGPHARVVEGGRAMVDPRYRGHHLMKATAPIRQAWFAEHGVLAMVGSAVTAHTRSQRDGPVTGVYLGFLPPIRFEGIDDTATVHREATLPGFIPEAEIPSQDVHLPVRDAEMIRSIYRAFELSRVELETGDTPPGDAPRWVDRTVVDGHVHTDLGHAVLSVSRIGADFPAAVAERVAASRRGGVEVVYADLPLDDPDVSWAADRLAEEGFVFAGVIPLWAGGVDVVRYQSLGTTEIDPGEIHLRSEAARELLAYVLQQRP